MSGRGKRQSSNRSGSSEGGGGGGGVSGGNDAREEDEIDGPQERISPEEETGNNRDRKGKGVSLFRFSGAKKKLLLLQRKRRRRKVSSGGGGGGGVGCWICMKQSMTLDSSVESPTSDPNSKEFTYDMLRVLIEKNDFYAKECNPHQDDKKVSPPA